MLTTDERILVVILATALSIFIIVAIVAVIKFIQILNRIKLLTEKAEELAEKAEAVGDFFNKTAKPAIILKTLSNIARSFRSKSKE